MFLDWALCINFALSTIKRSCVPEPIAPVESDTITENVSFLLLIPISSVRQLILLPIGDGAE